VVRHGRSRELPAQAIGSLAVIVPTYNTSATVPGVLTDLLERAGEAITEIMVIDNASADGTPEAVEALIERDPRAAATLRLVSNPRNLGYGGSIKRGFDETAARFDLVAVIHSDDQCDAGATLLTLLGGLDAGPDVDVVLASRFTAGADVARYSLVRRAGNAFFNGLTRLVSGYSMSDAGTAIMVARGPVISALPVDRLTSGYRFHPQLNLLLYGDPRLVVCEVPLMWHDASVGNRFSLAGYGIRLLRMLTVFAWRRRALGRPLHEAVIAAERPPE
jgi:glycosyltransferase involved in cell wall biosynthesis